MLNTCFAYLAICFLFSLVTYLFVEAPMANVLNEFIREEKLPETFVVKSPAKTEGPRRRLVGNDGEQPRRRKKRVKRPAANDTEAGSGAINDSLNESLKS